MTILVDILLAFGMMGLITWGVLKMDIQDRQPVEIYEYHGLTREVYADKLPVSVEDLLKVDAAGYSKKLDVKKTPLAAVYDASQIERRDMNLDDYPTMNYRLAICPVPALLQWGWKNWVEEYPDDGEMLIAMDPAPWGAVEAYREWFGSEEGGDYSYTWFICWEDRFVQLTPYWELDEDEMGIIAEKLTQWQEGGRHG